MGFGRTIHAQRDEQEKCQLEFSSGFLTQKELDPDFVDFNSVNRRYHFPARFYVPFRGRFAQIDPLTTYNWLLLSRRPSQIAQLPSGSKNRAGLLDYFMQTPRGRFSFESQYSYVSANPIMAVDPLGLQPYGTDFTKPGNINPQNSSGMTNQIVVDKSEEPNNNPAFTYENYYLTKLPTPVACDTWYITGGADMEVAPLGAKNLHLKLITGPDDVDFIGSVCVEVGVLIRAVLRDKAQCPKKCEKREMQDYYARWLRGPVSGLYVGVYALCEWFYRWRCVPCPGKEEMK